MLALTLFQGVQPGTRATLSARFRVEEEETAAAARQSGTRPVDVVARRKERTEEESCAPCVSACVCVVVLVYLTRLSYVAIRQRRIVRSFRK